MLLVPVLVDCVKDVVVGERGVILEFRKFERPVVDLPQGHLFDVRVFVAAAQFDGDGVGDSQVRVISDYSIGEGYVN